MADDIADTLAATEQLEGSVGRLREQTSALSISAASFSRAMTSAFVQSTTGGKQFEDVLKNLGLRLSSLVVGQAFKPIGEGIASGVSGLFSNLFGGASSSGGLTSKFADGGIVGTPTYFPLPNGNTGLAGEAGPEAILPLSRGADGRLGVAAGGSGGGAATIQVHIATPDAESFRRSEAYVTGQIARAVARGQRSL